MLRAVYASALLLLAAGVPAGVLEVRSQPGVEVVWEGVNLGTTDGRGRMVIRDIPPGEYSIVLRKDGHHPHRTDVRIDGGETTLRRQLERLAPEPAAEPPPAPSRPPARSAEPPAAKAPAAATAGDPTAPAGGEGKPSGEPGSGADPAPAAARLPETGSSSAVTRERPTAELRSAPPPPDTGTDDAASGGVPRLLYLLLAAVLGAAIFYMLRGPGRLLRPATAPPNGAAAPAIDGEPAAKEQEPVAAPQTDGSFLSDLRQREEKISSATRIVDGRQVVEVEVTDVEIVDEEAG